VGRRPSAAGRSLRRPAGRDRDARGLHHPRVPRGADRTGAAGHAGDRCDLPPARPAREGRDHAGRAVAGAGDVRCGRRLRGRRGRGDGVAAAAGGRAVRAARGDVADRPADVGRRRVPVPGQALHARPAGAQPEHGRSSPPADPDRRHGGAAHVAARGPLRRRVQRLRHPGRRRDRPAQARGAAETVRRDRPPVRRDREDDRHPVAAG
jgi:hypothetical protein